MSKETVVMEEEGEEAYGFEGATASRKVKALGDLKFRLETDYETLKDLQIEAKSEFERLRKKIDAYEEKFFKGLESWISTEEKKFQTLIHEIDEEKDESKLLDLLDTADVELSFREDKSVLSRIDLLKMEGYIGVETTKCFVPVVFTHGKFFEHHRGYDNNDVIQKSRKLKKFEEKAAKYNFNKTITINGTYSEYLAPQRNYVDCQSKEDKPLLCVTVPDKSYIANIKASLVCEESRYDWKEIIRFKAVEWARLFKWNESKFYEIGKENPNVVTALAGIELANSEGKAVVEGNAPFHLNKVTRWIIKILNSKDNNGMGIHIGVKVKSNKIINEPIEEENEVVDDDDDDKEENDDVEDNSTITSIAPVALGNNGGGLFGQPAPAPAAQSNNGGGLFGQPPAAAPAARNNSGGGLFGQLAAAPAAQSNNGGGLFGAPARNTGLNIFGAQPQSNIFGHAGTNNPNRNGQNGNSAPAQQDKANAIAEEERRWYLDCSRPVRIERYNSGFLGDSRMNENVHTGDVICVTMDATKGELSFTLNGSRCNFVHREIPLDKLLVPYVQLGKEGDSVEFIPVM